MVSWLIVLLLLIIIAYVVAERHEKYHAFRDTIMKILGEHPMKFEEISTCLEMISDRYLYRILSDLAHENKIVKWGGYPGIFCKKEMGHEVE